MKTLFKSLLILSAIFFLGCREVTFQGNLQVSDQLKVKNTDGKLVNLKSGDYPIDITASKRKVVMKISKNLEFELLLPKNVQIPENGSVTLKSANSGQPFDLVTEVKTTFQDSEAIRGFENCTTERWETVCTPNGCFQRSVTVWGQRRVVYKNRKITRDLKAEVLAKNSSLKLADSDAVNFENQRVYINQGYCY